MYERRYGTREYALKAGFRIFTRCIIQIRNKKQENGYNIDRQIYGRTRLY